MRLVNEREVSRQFGPIYLMICEKSNEPFNSIFPVRWSNIPEARIARVQEKKSAFYKAVALPLSYRGVGAGV